MLDAFANLAGGFAVALQWQNLLFALLGATMGTFIGVLPGLGPLTTVAILLPVTFYLEPVSSMIMLAGIYYGAQYGGSTTAILANLPGEATSVVTCIDGYQMARQGRAGSALAIAALGSCFAGIVATLVIAVAAPPLTRFAMLFGAPEYFSLMVLGLVAAIVLAQGSILRALAMVVLGLLIATIGSDPQTGLARVTFGVPQISDGISFVPVAMGLFAVPELLKNIVWPEEKVALDARVNRLWPTYEEFRLAWPAVVRGTALGSILGILPGGGALLSSFAAYAVEKKIARDPAKFGNGAVQGVAAPEAANNAGAQTSFIPLLTLGLPGNAVMAVMAGALIMKGIQPGPNVITAMPELFWGLIASMVVGNAMLLVINLPMIGLWVKLINVPYRLLYPSILVFCCLGTYMVGNSVVDIWMLLVFSALGCVLQLLKFEPAPLALSFVLGIMMEENFRRALQVSRGDFMIFINHPISAVLLASAVALLLVVILPGIKQKRKEAFQE